MESIGHIKVYRSMLEWEWYSDAYIFKLFMHLLLIANWKDGSWRGISIKRGQILTSIEKLSQQTKLTPQNIRTCIKRLKSTCEITCKSTNKFTLITIANYEDYQGLESKLTNKLTNNLTNNLTNAQQTTNKQPNNNRRSKEDKKLRSKEVKIKDKSFDTFFSHFNSELQDKIKEFIKFRNEIGKSFKSETSFQVWVKKLESFAEEDRIEILDNSIANGWQGIFSLKDKPKNKVAVKERTEVDYNNLYEGVRD